MTDEQREEAINMIRYFHEEKGDITRWSGWQLVVKQHFPDLAEALADYIKAKRYLDLVVKNLGE